MTRYAGVVGIDMGVVESQPGVYTPTITEFNVSGNVMEQRASWTSGEHQQETARASHDISVYMTDEIRTRFSSAVYITWQNVKWSISNVRYHHPRVIFSLGVPYNE